MSNAHERQGERRRVDLRSDTVTTPTAAMRRAMAEAEVGDDVYGEDPTVARLQATLAEMAGFDGGLFVPTGTMSNQVAVAVHCPRGTEVVMPAGAHVYEYEPGSMAVISGATPRFVPAPLGAPDPADVAAVLRSGGHQAPSGLVVLENTHNGAGGTVVPLETQAAVQRVAHSAGLPVHLDGARAFNAAAALGVPIADVCRGFDSVSICLSKGLGAPVGSVLLGSAGFLAEAHRYRKLLGGGMRQVGVLAAAALVALETMPGALSADHERARRLALGLADVPGLTVNLESVQTNMVYVTVDFPGDPEPASTLAAACASRGVVFNALARDRARLVTHHQVDDEAVTVALAVIGEEAAQLTARASA